jgi:transposase
MKYMMSKAELGKLTVIQGAVDGAYTVKEAARRLRLHLSERRIKQLKKHFREQGEAAVIHGNAGKHPANYTDEQLRHRIIALKQGAVYEHRYSDCLGGMKFFLTIDRNSTNLS